MSKQHADLFRWDGMLSCADEKLQNEFDTGTSVENTLISRDNFILFTPMLPEVASGMIETRNIVTPNTGQIVL